MLASERVETTTLRSWLFVKQGCLRKNLLAIPHKLVIFYLGGRVVCIEFSIYTITSKCFFKLISVN